MDIQPTYYVTHPDGSFTKADPQPIERLTTGQPKIAGYRNLTEAEIALMNRIKAHAEETRALVHEVNMHLEGIEYSTEDPAPSLTTDPYRWLGISSDQLQLGYMALVRAVARPTPF